MEAERPEDRYSRQVLFSPLGADGQRRLRAGKVLVVGCGALGTHSAEHLARAGVGFLRLVDRDIVDITNLARQSAFTEADAREGAAKAPALGAWLGRVNSEVEVDARAVECHRRNALDLARGMDLILDGSDNVPTRFLINEASLELGVPWIYCGVVGETGHAQLFHPACGPCLRCLLPAAPGPGELPTCDTAGVLGPAVGAIAAIQSAMALRWLAEGMEDARGGTSPLIGRQLRLRVWSLEAAVSRVERDPACPACGAGSREHLEGRAGDASTVLCGRNAIQVRPDGPGEGLDLKALAGRLRALGAVEERRFLLRFQAEGLRLTVFPDARLIVEGTTDPARARSIYARYIGA